MSSGSGRSATHSPTPSSPAPRCCTPACATPCSSPGSCATPRAPGRRSRWPNGSGDGTWLDPRRAKLTMGEWCDEWLRGYSVNRPSTVRQAQVHVRVIRDTLGNRPLRELRPSEIKTWVASLQKRYAPSTVYALHRRLSQILADAVHDGILPKSPTSRRTSPPHRSSGPTLRPPSRSGRSTTRCRSTSAPSCCSAHSPASASPRSPHSESTTLTSCAASSPLQSSTPANRSRPR